MTTTETNTSPDTTLGWDRGRLFGVRAWNLDETDLIVQHDDAGWNIYVEHELYGAEWLETVETWADVLGYCLASPAGR